MFQRFYYKVYVWLTSQMLVNQPDRHDVRWKKAYVLYCLGRYHDAIHEFEILLRAKHQEVDCLYEIACCYTDLGDFGEAQTHVKKALSISPEDKDCLDLLQRLE